MSSSSISYVISNIERLGPLNRRYLKATDQNPSDMVF